MAHLTNRTETFDDQPSWTADDEQAWQEHSEAETTPTSTFCPVTDDHRHEVIVGGDTVGNDIFACEACGYGGVESSEDDFAGPDDEDEYRRNGYRYAY